MMGVALALIGILNIVITYFYVNFCLSEERKEIFRIVGENLDLERVKHRKLNDYVVEVDGAVNSLKKRILVLEETIKRMEAPVIEVKNDILQNFI